MRLILGRESGFAAEGGEPAEDSNTFYFCPGHCETAEMQIMIFLCYSMLQHVPTNSQIVLSLWKDEYQEFTVRKVPWDKHRNTSSKRK